jgi:hypothetical protein
MALVAFVVNRTLLRDPRRFDRRCRGAAADRGWEPWMGLISREREPAELFAPETREASVI